MNFWLRLLTNNKLPPVQQSGFYLCKFIFYLSLLYPALFKIYYIEDFFYSVQFFELPQQSNWLISLAKIIRSEEEYFILFWYADVLCILINLLFRRSVVASFTMLFFQLMNIHVLWFSSCATDAIAHYFIVLFLFTDLSKIYSYRRFRVLHFLVGIRAIQIQMATMYFFAGFLKLLNPGWFQGLALTYLFKTDYVSKYSFQIFDTAPLAGVFCVYAVLVFECLFFTTFVIPRLRAPFIVFGVAMHFVIGVLLAYLWDLSFMSISLYALLIDWRLLVPKSFDYKKSYQGISLRFSTKAPVGPLSGN